MQNRISWMRMALQRITFVVLRAGKIELIALRCRQDLALMPEPARLCPSWTALSRELQQGLLPILVEVVTTRWTS